MPNIFHLDISILEGGLSIGTEESIIEGRGRGITLEWEQGDLDGGMQILGYSCRFMAAEPEAKEIL